MQVHLGAGACGMGHEDLGALGHPEHLGALHPDRVPRRRSVLCRRVWCRMGTSEPAGVCQDSAPTFKCRIWVSAATPGPMCTLEAGAIHHLQLLRLDGHETLSQRADARISSVQCVTVRAVTCMWLVRATAQRSTCDCLSVGSQWRAQGDVKRQRQLTSRQQAQLSTCAAVHVFFRGRQYGWGTKVVSIPLGQQSNTTGLWLIGSVHLVAE